MNLTTLTDKQLNEMERLATELAALLKRTKLTHDPLYLTLTNLRTAAGNVRQERFDQHDHRYQGY
jgi:hypothetical protein